jgi:serine/threonine protein kinase
VKKRKVATPPPHVGRYGIQDADDLEAWKKVDGPFNEMGFRLIRQLGMGQFGRVYEAVNRENPHIPQLVALKVDRIQPGDKKRAIQEAGIALHTARDLSLSPHVIRIYDAGKLSGKKYTYHILQRVDGETLDHLAGVAGSEHASFHGPKGRTLDGTLPLSYSEALEASVGESWRAERLSTAFTDPLSISHCLDLITSMLLWVEEIHQIGYAINDLKNGNLMISRRGQMKGIDLDSYEPASLPSQRTPDFVFLAVTLVLLLLNVRRGDTNPFSADSRLTHDLEELRKVLNETWAFGDVTRLSDGRMQQADIVNLFVDLIQGCRDYSFAHEPEKFSAFVDRFIHLKRRTILDEIVLD